MDTKFLLPHQFLQIGLIFLIPAIILMIASSFYGFEVSWLELKAVRDSGLLISADENFTNELGILGTFISLFFIAFSKEKIEDEYILKLRLESLLSAFYLYSIILILGTLVFYHFNYLNFIILNIFSIQIFYILRFRWVMYKQNETIVLI